jgi:hypothetical protein
MKSTWKQHQRYPYNNQLQQRAQFTRKKWLQMKAKAQHDEWEQLCQSIIVNPHQPASMWRAFGKTLPSNFMPLRSVSDNPSNPNTSLPSDPSQAMNTMAVHFSNVCSEHSNPTPHVCHDAVKTYLSVIAAKRLRFPPPPLQQPLITALDVENICRRLTNPKKAVGPDEIHPCFLRYGTPKLYDLLAHLMSFSLQHAVLPQQWKQANVSPLYKGKGLDISNPSSCRPISVTSAAVRVMERILHEQIQQKLDNSGFHIAAQAGFRKGRSCYDNIYQLTEAIHDSYLRGSSSHLPVAFLDLQKAFDSVWHDGLLFKLAEQAHLPEHLLCWIQSFLTDRQLRVVQSNLSSDWYPIMAGVPQGSVLAPLLFLIFINDLEKYKLPTTKLCLLADDIVLWPEMTGRYSTRNTNLQQSLRGCHE